MKAPYQWIKRYVALDASPEEFARRMIMSGTEAEDIIEPGQGMEHVVVGRIDQLEKHPDADRLQICTMDVGQDAPITIVTGADNVFEGALVPVALDGADLPCGTKIKTSKLRGVRSEGMLCSGEELCIGDEVYPGASVDGIMILREDYMPGTPIAQVLGLDDTVIDFKILANRPDCLSITGLAREAGAVFSTPYTPPPAQFKTTGGNIAQHLRVRIDAPDLCPRYMARVVTNVRLAPSPKWMREALTNAGVRAINNIVDITNYVMLELGQPLHAFDHKYVNGSSIIVRRAQNGEHIITLDEKERVLRDSMLVIADEEGPIAIAGIMGGEHSGIMDDTKTVVFESANFEWTQVRVTSRALGMRTESSSRYEKGLPPQLAQRALNRAMALVQELDCGDIVEGEIDVYPAPADTQTLCVSPSRINAHLGVEIPVGAMVEILTRLGFEVTLAGDALSLIVPDWRRDITSFADIAEEVMRLYGYAHIPDELPPSRGIVGGRTTRQRMLLGLKRALSGMGLEEAVNYSFMAPADLDRLRIGQDSPLRRAVPLLNPLSEEFSLMRTTLVPSLLRNVALNLNRKTGGIRLFEQNRVFLPHALPLEELPQEAERVCIALCGEGDDFYTLKAIVEEVLRGLRIGKYHFQASAPAYLHPGRSAALEVGGRPAGELGELHPEAARAMGIEARVYVAELDLELLMEQASPDHSVRPLPRYPAMVRDLSVSVETAQPVGPMLATIQKAGGKLLERVALFDIYAGAQAGEGRKSLAFKLTLRHPERTLVEEEANACFTAVVAALEKGFGAVLRG